MSTEKKYWKSLEEFDNDAAFIEQAHKEFPEQIPVAEFLGNQQQLEATSTSRRDFLKFLGFSITAASLAACETPVIRAIPYLVKPEEITVGEANWYASTYADGVDYCPVLVKTREGRPIHIEGNNLSSITNGGTHARVNASVLSLYDRERLPGPKKEGQDISWEQADEEITGRLKGIASSGGKIAILSNTILSPSTKFVIQDFSASLAGVDGAIEDNDEKVQNKAGAVTHVTYDPVSYSGMIKANEDCFGKAVLPSFQFNKAKVIVSIGADFLVNWLSPIEFANQYAMTRKPDGKWMSKHYQFETTLSVTGSNADVRGAIKPSESGLVALALYNMIAKKAGESCVSSKEIQDENDVNNKISEAARALLENKGESLVVTGSNDKSIQGVVNAINYLLGNYGNTIDLDIPGMMRQGDDEKVAELVNDMNAGKVGALIIYGANPSYNMPGGWRFNEALSKVGLTISLSDRMDETASQCTYVCPDSHYLESWNDSNPKMGHYGLTQPVIRKLFKTRQVQSTLLKWAGKDLEYKKYIQEIWKKYGYKEEMGNFTSVWNKWLHDGLVEIPNAKNAADEEQTESQGEDSDYIGDLKEMAATIVELSNAGDWEMELYMKTGIGEGNQANNPWLQEFADPITRVVWDNYITMNPADMKGTYNTRTGQRLPASKAKISVMGNDHTVTLPVVAVPGQRRGTIGVALGYGRMSAGKAGNSVGANAFPYVHFVNGTLNYTNQDVKIEKVEGDYDLASCQTHHTMMGRRIVQETDINTFKNVDRNDKRNGWNKDVTFVDSYGKEKKARQLDLWQPHEVESMGYRWGMSIDLNACIGCGACVVSCMSENNVPVVGKDEVIRNREMTWLRIDRYYSSDANKKDNSYKEMEDPSTYPEVSFQPIMCQHCNHAPCETVCPVEATTHSNEGLNQMAYNRCVGTRYCANNCPYKVRRFNWFNYTKDNSYITDTNPSQNELGRMVLNPDVVVRSRGVMEKCSMCVQRIQAGKLQTKKAGRPVTDGDISTACQAACPTNAITFGDVNNKESQVSKISIDERAYHLLEEVGVQPNVWYMVKVWNRDAKMTKLSEEDA